MLTSHDYTYMFWAHGWRGESPDGKRVMCVRTGDYGCAFDTETAGLLNFGPIANTTSASEALIEDNQAIYGLSPATLTWELTVGGNSYIVRRSSTPDRTKENLESLGLPLSLLDDATPGEQTRMIVSGRFVQRFDMEKLCFEDAHGETLPVTGRVEVTALPHYMAVTMEVGQDAGEGIDVSSLTARLQIAGSTVRVSPTQVAEVQQDDATSETSIAVPAAVITKEQSLRLSFFVVPERRAPDFSPVSAVSVTGEGLGPYTDRLTSRYDAERGLHWLSLPGLSGAWDMENNRDMMERVKLTIANASDRPARVPLVFSKDGEFVGVTGLTPILRDLDGQPLGIPVQVSKNWHTTPGKTFLYQGPWFQGYTVLEVAAGCTFECELTIAYALWGGVPAASHAQLCLIGYGGNQLWDEAAIGSFGETITYDPDVCLGRSIIDDVRPLMVNAMGGGKWSWTNNVGGGDFLVYFNERNEKQYLTRMKAFYEHYGPNLTNVHYAGVSADGKIEAHLKVSTPRCDDINRAYHRFRYDVKEPVEFSRLAFYQLGSDGYNNHQFNKMAWGDKGGLQREWEPGRGGLTYEVTGLPCEGEQTWFSLHDSIPGLTHTDGAREASGAWANRGMVIRSWSARLGGKDVPYPHASVFLTEDNIGSANVEISAPPGVTQLLPGDYVECEVELLILPMSASDYYGPNERLRASLDRAPNSWESVHRQAVGNDLQVTASTGEVLHLCPVIVRADDSNVVEFEIQGGISYVPVTVTGLSTCRNICLFEHRDGGWRKIDQSVQGNDFWQTEYDPEACTWTRIYNVDLGQGDGIQAFRVSREA